MSQYQYCGETYNDDNDPNSKLDEEEKIWGTTRVIFSAQRYSKHYLVVKANSYCSLHYHENRANDFELIKGKVEVISFYGPQIKKNVLTSGNKLTIPSLVPHIFFAHEDSIMTEEYHGDRGHNTIHESDIVRIMNGGKDTYEGMLKAVGNLFAFTEW